MIICISMKTISFLTAVKNIRSLMKFMNEILVIALIGTVLTSPGIGCLGILPRRKPGAVMKPTLPSLATLQVVVIVTCGVASDDIWLVSRQLSVFSAQ